MELFKADFRKELGTQAALCSKAGAAVARSHSRH
jgi:hypothetical protein